MTFSISDGQEQEPHNSDTEDKLDGDKFIKRIEETKAQAGNLGSCLVKDKEFREEQDCYGVDYVVASDSFVKLEGLLRLRKAVNNFLEEEEINSYKTAVWVSNPVTKHPVKKYQIIFVGVIHE